MLGKKLIFCILVLFLVSASLTVLSDNAHGLTIQSISVAPFAYGCKQFVLSPTCTASVSCSGGTSPTSCCPNSGDIVTVVLTLYNEQSTTQNPGYALFRLEGNSTATGNPHVDLFFGGSTYMNTTTWGGLNWGPSYDEVVNVPEIPPLSTYTVKTNFSLLSQELGILPRNSDGSINATVRAEVFGPGFTPYVGTTTASLRMQNNVRRYCPNGTNSGSAAPVLLLTNSAVYGQSDDIYMEASFLSAGGVSGYPEWGDSSTLQIDIIQLVDAATSAAFAPSGDPEADCSRACGGSTCGTDSCAHQVQFTYPNCPLGATGPGATPAPFCPQANGVVGTLSYATVPATGSEYTPNGNWNLNRVTDCPPNHICYKTDLNYGSPSTNFYYSSWDGDLNAPPYTNYTHFPASWLPGTGYYLIRSRAPLCYDTKARSCGTPSHPITAPQWTYFKVGTPTFARISDFGAYPDGGRTVVEWKTSAEIRTIGFYLLRLNDATGSYEQVNDKMVPALVGSPGGGVYMLADSGAYQGGTYSYKLVEVENKGAKIEHGPYTVQVTGTGTHLTSAFSSEPLPVTAAKEARIAKAKKTRDAGNFARKSLKGGLLKLGITEDGLYFLPASDIVSITGMNPQNVANMIRNKLFDLSTMGREVAYRAAVDGSGIYFYGRAADSIYTSENIYWLSQRKGLPMTEVKSERVNPVRATQMFSDTVHLEQNNMAAPGLFSDPKADYWFWDYVLSGYDGMDTKTFTVTAKGVAASVTSATLSVSLQGITSAGGDIDHDVVVSLNGTVIGEDRWQGATPHTLTATFSQALLHEGDNAVEVHGVLDPGVPYSMFFVDSFDLTYKRLYAAVNDSLSCRGDGNQVVTVGGFTNPAISVFDITDADNPEYVSGTLIESAGGGYRVSFTPGSPQEVYLAVSSAGINSNFDKWASQPFVLTGRSNRADYLIITTAGLQAAAQPLASFRKGKGLQPMIVDVESIMDEFNYGVFDPNAIRSFLTYAYWSWSKPPKYVLLAGNGSYDYRDYLGYGDDFVPPLMVGTPYGLQPSDNTFADINGDAVPEMAIGRLPVVSGDELQSVTNKIISYENASAGAWQKSVLMAAGAADPDAGDFPADSDGVASLVPSGYAVDKIYLSRHPVDEAAGMLLGQLNQGVFLFNYIGHGADDRLDNGGLLTIDDVSSMTNGPALPVVTAMTCFMNNSAYPGYDTLGETLLLKDNGGAAAVWGPTGLSLDSEAVSLDKKLFNAIFSGGQLKLGDAVLNALEDYGSGGGKPFMLDIYNIIGDPALTLR